MAVKEEDVTTETVAAPTPARMASRRELPAYITAYVARLIREWERANPGVAMERLAAKLHISRAQVLNVRDGTRGAGHRLEEAMAKMYHGGSVDALRVAAAAYHEGKWTPPPGLEAAESVAPSPEEEQAAQSAAELRLALDFLRDTYPPAFLAYAETKAPHAIGDSRTRLEWLDWIRSLYGPWSRRKGESRPTARADVPVKRKSRTA